MGRHHLRGNGRTFQSLEPRAEVGQSWLPELDPLLQNRYVVQTAQTVVHVVRISPLASANFARAP